MGLHITPRGHPNPCWDYIWPSKNRNFKMGIPQCVDGSSCYKQGGCVASVIYHKLSWKSKGTAPPNSYLSEVGSAIWGVGEGCRFWSRGPGNAASKRRRGVVAKGINQVNLNYIGWPLNNEKIQVGGINTIAIWSEKILHGVWHLKLFLERTIHLGIVSSLLPHQ